MYRGIPPFPNLYPFALNAESMYNGSKTAIEGGFLLFSCAEAVTEIHRKSNAGRYLICV
jgi:hypothetical protein